MIVATLAELAPLTSMVVIRDGRISDLGMLNSSGSAMLVPFFDAKYLQQLAASDNISAVLTTPELLHLIPNKLAVATSNDALSAFFSLHINLCQSEFYWRSFKSQISASARLHPASFVAERDVQIGDRTIIGPGAIVLERSIIGEDVVIHPGVVIGTEGFEVRQVFGTQLVIPHAGGVRVGDRVQLQANTCVSRAIFRDFTEIGSDSALDNLVHVAHGVRIGRRCRIASCTNIAGSVTIDDDVWIGPNSTISNGLHIGEKAEISLGAVVTRDVAPGKKVSGNFAIEHSKFLQFIRQIR
jgi:UDP-3-O-[3-hydroxymyristoyl] glucosamine N-acyltransferase